MPLGCLLYQGGWSWKVFACITKESEVDLDISKFQIYQSDILLQMTKVKCCHQKVLNVSCLLKVLLYLDDKTCV